MDLRTLLELRQAYPLSWSRDGAWLLVASDLSGTRQLYRLPVAGGDLEQLTNYDEHSRVGAKHGEFVTDEICDRFCVLGTAEQAKAKLQELQGVGVDQFNIYLMTRGQEETLQAFGDEIVPELAATPA